MPYNTNIFILHYEVKKGKKYMSKGGSATIGGVRGSMGGVRSGSLGIGKGISLGSPERGSLSGAFSSKGLAAFKPVERSPSGFKGLIIPKAEKSSIKINTDKIGLNKAHTFGSRPELKMGNKPPIPKSSFCEFEKRGITNYSVIGKNEIAKSPQKKIKDSDKHIPGAQKTAIRETKVLWSAPKNAELSKSIPKSFDVKINIPKSHSGVEINLPKNKSTAIEKSIQRSIKKRSRYTGTSKEKNAQVPLQKIKLSEVQYKSIREIPARTDIKVRPYESPKSFNVSLNLPKENTNKIEVKIPGNTLSIEKSIRRNSEKKLKQHAFKNKEVEPRKGKAIRSSGEQSKGVPTYKKNEIRKDKSRQVNSSIKIEHKKYDERVYIPAAKLREKSEEVKTRPIALHKKDATDRLYGQEKAVSIARVEKNRNSFVSESTHPRLGEKSRFEQHTVSVKKPDSMPFASKLLSRMEKSGIKTEAFLSHKSQDKSKSLFTKLSSIQQKGISSDLASAEKIVTLMTGMGIKQARAEQIAMTHVKDALERRGVVIGKENLTTEPVGMPLTSAVSKPSLSKALKAEGSSDEKLELIRKELNKIKVQAGFIVGEDEKEKVEEEEDEEEKKKKKIKVKKEKKYVVPEFERDDNADNRRREYAYNATTKIFEEAVIDSDNVITGKHIADKMPENTDDPLLTSEELLEYMMVSKEYLRDGSYTEVKEKVKAAGIIKTMSEAQAMIEAVIYQIPATRRRHIKATQDVKEDDRRRVWKHVMKSV